MKKEQEYLNKYYWAFMYLILSCPEEYLNNKGKIIFQMVLEQGECHSITAMAKHLKLHKCVTSKICKYIKGIEHIALQKNKNCKSIQFHPAIIAQGLDIAFKVLKR